MIKIHIRQCRCPCCERQRTDNEDEDAERSDGGDNDYAP